MRSGSTQYNIETARKAADRLAELGENFHAEAVRRLCRSNSSLIDTCSRLHGDNADLKHDLQRVMRRENALLNGEEI